MAQSDVALLSRHTQRRRLSAWWNSARSYLLIASFYVLMLLITDARFMGDTVWYAFQIRRGALWEAGHLLWRPLGFLLWHLLNPLTERFVGPNVLNNLVFILVLMNWITGFVAVASLYGVVRRLSHNCLQSYGVVLGFICTQGFLNYTQSGSSYSTSLACLLLGLYLLVRGTEATRSGWAIAAGASLALAVGMWLPFVFAMPAAITSPLLLFGWNHRNVLLVLMCGLSFCVVTTTIYTLGAVQAGVTSLPALQVWFGEASHGITTGGFERMVFGFGRSFINMGNDGLLFKRYLLGDVYNPVSFFDLVTVSLWKFGLFYCFLLAISLPLLRTREQRGTFVFLAMTCVPVLAFASFWQGGDMERYLALYPAVFMSTVAALSVLSLRSVFAGIIWLFIVVAAVINLSVMSKDALHQQQERAIARIDEILPKMHPESMIVTVNQQDELWQFNHSAPFHPVFQQFGEFVYAIPTHNWRQRVATKVLNTWHQGGAVWILKRMLRDRPQADWYWVEGDEVRHRWVDIQSFFQQFEYGVQTSASDGFILLVPSAKNEQLLSTSDQP